ncbi:MAG: helix-turn-helix transcriptional regulator [Leptolyngbya sp.]|nr:helix-turn-helix transcriptional regulator [Candidatus Melainabacteria bacterium]
MGHASRQRPARLASKLLQIRKFLGLSQNQMIRRLGFKGELIQSHISAYEQEGENGREPPLGVLLQYARTVKAPVEVLIDDRLDLEMPSTQRKPVKRRVSKQPAPISLSKPSRRKTKHNP